MEMNCTTSGMWEEKNKTKVSERCGKSEAEADMKYESLSEMEQLF